MSYYFQHTKPGVPLNMTSAEKKSLWKTLLEGLKAEEDANKVRDLTAFKILRYNKIYFFKIILEMFILHFILTAARGKI